MPLFAHQYVPSVIRSRLALHWEEGYNQIAGVVASSGPLATREVEHKTSSEIGRR